MGVLPSLWASSGAGAQRGCTCLQRCGWWTQLVWTAGSLVGLWCWKWVPKSLVLQLWKESSTTGSLDQKGLKALILVKSPWVATSNHSTKVHTHLYSAWSNPFKPYFPHCELYSWASSLCLCNCHALVAMAVLPGPLTHHLSYCGLS